MLTALIMAGGSGERFWPLSTKKKPKQLLKLFSKKSMIRETVDRILPIIPTERIFIATNIEQVEGIKKELPFLPEKNIIIEPAMKDTAAAIGYSAMYIDKYYKNSQMIVLASDHLIESEQTFRDIIVKAGEKSKDSTNIITLGITADSPKTGYGYIEIKKDELEEEKEFYNVKAFHEKPNYETAEYYMEQGNYYWNSGMFIWETSTILKNIEIHMEEHWKVFFEIKKKIDSGIYGGELAKSVKDDFEKFEKISIDFGVMEKADNILVIPADIGWNDIGNFNALEEVYKANKNGTVVKESKVVEIDSGKNIIVGSGDKVVATVGVENLIIVDTENGLLVCNKNDSQHIKKVVKELNKF